MRRSTIAAIVLGAAVAVGACRGDSAEEAGPQTVKDFKVADFKRIEAAGPYDVTVTTGSAASVRVEGPQNVLDRLVVEVKGDQLRIYRDKGRNIQWGRNSVKIAVTVPELHGATLAGSGTIEVDKVTADTFKGSIAGSGDLSIAEVAVKSLEIEIAGSGSAAANGRADKAKYGIAGSGEVDVSKLQSRDIELTIAGSGSISAKATGTVTGEIMGSGEVRVTGGAKCTVEKMGSGSIDCS